MKLSEFDKYLRKNNCSILREGGNHTIYKNSNNLKFTAVPRHKEIKKVLIIKICKQLGIPSPFN